jgi:hypothetical protein
MTVVQIFRATGNETMPEFRGTLGSRDEPSGPKKS